MQTGNRRLLLDTHIWIQFVMGDGQLSETTVTLLRDAAKEGRIFLSAISLWELGMLVSHKRIVLNMPILEWVQQSFSALGVSLVGLSPDIAIGSSFLPGDFHGDPADRLIVATARSENLFLVTKDKAILRYARDHYVQVISA